MTTPHRAAASLASAALVLLLTAGCRGGSEDRAADENAAATESAQTAAADVDAKEKLSSISPAIPVYADAEFRPELTKRDQVMIRGRYGNDAEVYTLATDDSFPQVYHYYTTYLGQFRAFETRDTYPPEREDWRTLEVQLNDVMKDPFIPGYAMPPGAKQVTLQIAENEAEPRTVIRYIVRPAAAGAPAATVADSSTPEPTTTAAP